MARTALVIELDCGVSVLSLSDSEEEVQVLRAPPPPSGPPCQPRSDPVTASRCVVTPCTQAQAQCRVCRETSCSPLLACLRCGGQEHRLCADAEPPFERWLCAACKPLGTPGGRGLATTLAAGSPVEPTGPPVLEPLLELTTPPAGRRRSSANALASPSDESRLLRAAKRPALLLPPPPRSKAAAAAASGSASRGLAMAELIRGKAAYSRGGFQVPVQVLGSVTAPAFYTVKHAGAGTSSSSSSSSSNSSSAARRGTKPPQAGFLAGSGGPGYEAARGNNADTSWHDETNCWEGLGRMSW
jgi:hypothetical protein